MENFIFLCSAKCGIIYKKIAIRAGDDKRMIY